MFKLNKLNDKWFFSNTNSLYKLLLVYIKGDALIVLPIWIVILITSFIDWRFMLIEIGALLSLRGIGEMIYWLLQQFSDRQYRPDNKFKELSNNAIYILYQLSGMLTSFVGICLIVFTIIYCY
jgi:hypothetical protein